MYSERITTQSLERIESQCDFKLRKLDAGRVQDIAQHLTSLKKSTGGLKRSLTTEESQFIRNERIVCQMDFLYWAERYCNPPEAPIWMGDLSFKSIGDIQAGESVVGWAKAVTQPTEVTEWRVRRGEHKWNRRVLARDHLIRARVVAVQRREAEIVKVRMESGSVIRCTRDHLWASWWRQSAATDQLWISAAPGRSLRRFITPSIPTPPEDVWLAGWLGGMYDGEGSWRSIAQSESHNPLVFEKLVAALSLLEIPFTIGKDRFQITGGRDGLLKFLNIAKPFRREVIERLILGQCRAQKDAVLSVEPDGYGEVVSIQTETGNYVAWGYGSKNCTIQKDGVEGGGIGKLRLWETQQILHDKIAAQEEKGVEAIAAGATADGILIVDHKDRQVGHTMYSRALSMHRLTLWPHTRGMAASVDDDKVLELYDRDKLILDNLPWYMQPKGWPDNCGFNVKGEHIYFEALNCRLLYQQGKQQSGLGQGRQFDVSHITEVASLPYPAMLEHDFFPTLPQNPYTVCILESTAQGRRNYWHDFTERVRKGRSARWVYVFVPYYAEKKKYRRTPPPNWQPEDLTMLHAKKVYETSKEFVGYDCLLARETLYWYETTRREYQDANKLNLFLTNYAATPEESFQHTNISAFSTEVMEKLRLNTRPGTPYEVRVGNVRRAE